MSERRPGPSVRVVVSEHAAADNSETTTRRREDRVVAEEPLEVRLSVAGLPAARAWVTMRTPGHDFELAAGWVVNEGLCEPRDVSAVRYCTDEALSSEEEFNVVTLEVARGREPSHRHAAASAGSSACGVCGKDSVEAVLDVRRGARWGGPLPSPDVVRHLPTALRGSQTLFDQTGGCHAAGLATAAGDLLVVREDVGRHNAVDKVVGARVLHGEEPAQACLVVSGRAGYELVQKAVTSGIGCLVAVGAPTSLSVRLAREAGLGLWGFTQPDRAVRYA